MNAEQPKRRKAPRHGPLPMRAIRRTGNAETDLSALDLRVLAAVAHFDRMSCYLGGGGAYASHEKLAETVNCHRTSLSSSLNKLVRLGYLLQFKNPRDRRKTSVFRVIYDGDEALLLPEFRDLANGAENFSTGKISPGEFDSRPGNNLPPPIFPPEQITAKIVCLASKKRERFEQVGGLEYILKNEDSQLGEDIPQTGTPETGRDVDDGLRSEFAELSKRVASLNRKLCRSPASETDADRALIAHVLSIADAPQKLTMAAYRAVATTKYLAEARAAWPDLTPADRARISAATNLPFHRVEAAVLGGEGLTSRQWSVVGRECFEIAWAKSERERRASK